MAKKKFKVNVLFGSDAVSRFFGDEPVTDGMLVKREFNTEDELKAYCKGLQDGDGWCDYTTLSDSEYRRVKKQMDSE